MSRRQLNNLRVLITGASQGIGRELVVQSLNRGCRVLATARSADLLEQLRREQSNFGDRLHICIGDVSRPTDRQRMLDAAREHFDGLDVLLNNAGFGASGPFVETQLDTLRAIYDTNYFGLVELTRLAIPLLADGTTPAIVNISSILGKRSWPARAYYSSSKYAVQGFSDALRAELAPRGIDVVVVCPGLTNTNFPKNMRENKASIPLNHQRGMSVQAVARATLDALEQGREETHLTFLGRLLVLVNRLAPSLVDRLAKRKIRKLYADEIHDRQRYRDAAQQAGR